MENTFNLREFFISLLKKWKLIFIFAIIFAILAGAYKGFGLMKTKQDIEANASNLDDYFDDETRKQEVYDDALYVITQNILKLETELIDTADYRKNSILYNLNPYNTAVSRMTVYVDTQDAELNIIEAYKDLVFSDELIEEISDKKGVDSRFIKELIKIDEKNLYNHDYKKNEYVVLNIDANYSIFTVVAYDTDTLESEETIEAIKSFILEQSENINSAISSHNLEIINSSSGYEYVSAIYDFQKSQANYYKTINDGLTEYNTYLKDLKAPQTNQISINYIIKQIIIFMVLGAAIGFVLAVIVIFMMYLVSDNLMIKNVLAEKNIFDLGYYINNKKKISAFLSWIYKLEGHNFKNLNKEKSANIIKNNVDFLLDDNDITLISSNNKIDLQKISEALNQNNVKSDYLNDNLNNPELISKIKAGKSLVVVEDVNKSSQTSLNNLIEHVNKYNYNISGYILTM